MTAALNIIFKIELTVGKKIKVDDIAYTSESTADGDNVVTVTLSAGSHTIDGKEVAQLYVKELNKEVYRPEKELKAFKKVFVPAHGEVRVKIYLDDRAFAYYSTAIDAWKVHSGLFEIQICSDVESVKLVQTVEIKAYSC